MVSPENLNLPLVRNNFLDEIGDMPLEMQAKILRVLNLKNLKELAVIKRFSLM